MKVLQVIPSVSSKHGGPSYAIGAYARALQSIGIEVTIATTDDDGGSARLPVPLGQPVERHGVPHFFFRRDLLPYKVSFGLARWLGRNAAKFDLVHLHALFSFSSSVAGRSARRAGVPYVVRPLGVLNRWGMENRRKYLKQLSLRVVELPLLKQAAALHFTTQAEADEAMSLSADLLRVRRAIIPVPVEVAATGDAAVFHSRFPATAGRKIVLFLSRIDPKKGIELLLEAFAKAHLEDSSLLLVIAGAGAPDYLRSLQARAEQLKIAKESLWTGHLEGVEKAAAFAAASVLVLVSHSENFGVAPVEAMAAGVPIIISHEVAISADVQRAGAGLVTRRSADEIAEAIGRTLTEKIATSRRIENAGKLVRDLYSTAAVGGGLKDLYESILHDQGAIG